MTKLITASELYEAARETCLRLYVANGGNPDDLWTVQPYPGTAAIACESVYDYSRRGNSLTKRKHWQLHMPAYPVIARLPLWHGELIAAYTVHELLHSLWTDFSVSTSAHGHGVGALVNSLEDVRIEHKAQSSLNQVSEAKRLLEALTAHIVARAFKGNANFVSEHTSFAFTLNCVLMLEHNGYRLPGFPANWRALVGPMLPLFELALKRIGQCRSTQDVLNLALELQSAAKQISVSKPKPPQQDAKGAPQSQQGAGEQSPSRPADDLFSEDDEDGAGEGKGKGKDDEDEDDDDDEDGASSKGKRPGDEDDEGEGEDGASSAGDKRKGEDAPITPPDASSADNEDASKNDAKSEGKGAGKGDDGAGDEDGAGEGAGKHGANKGDDGAGDEGKSDLRGGTEAPDLSDNAQTYDEANLNDLAQQFAQEHGKDLSRVEAQNRNASAFFSAPPSIERNLSGNGSSPDKVGALIQTPARLRRHVINAVKSPERVGVERKQSAGRWDMREMMAARMGTLNVFRRRVEDEGREVAVSLLIDGSSSMCQRQYTANADGTCVVSPSRMEASACLALHIGDALRIASVPFEIAGMHVGSPINQQERARVDYAKRFEQPWTGETRDRAAALASYAAGGTVLMPAMKTMVRNLAKRSGVTRRVLLVLSDGMDSFHPQNIVALRAWANAMGVEVIGVGMQISGGERGPFAQAFGDDKIYVDDVKALSKNGFKALQVLLDAPSKAKRALAS